MATAEEIAAEVASRARKLAEFIVQPGPFGAFRQQQIESLYADASQLDQLYADGKIGFLQYSLATSENSLRLIDAYGLPQSTFEVMLDVSSLLPFAEIVNLGRGVIRTGIPEAAHFAQKTWAANFSVDGAEALSKQFGVQIKTSDDLVQAIKAGTVNPNDLVVHTANINGETFIVNSRTYSTLREAGIARNEMQYVDVTDDAEAMGRLYGQFARNSLDADGKLIGGASKGEFIDEIRKTGTKDLTRCFLANTPIRLFDGSETGISAVRVGDIVSSFQIGGGCSTRTLMPGTVSEVFLGVSDQIISLRGIHVTPGHCFLTRGGIFVPIADILLVDGTLIDEAGNEIRARTGINVDAEGDVIVRINFGSQEHLRSMVVRLGIPCGKFNTCNGAEMSLLDFLSNTGQIESVGGIEVLREAANRGCPICFEWPYDFRPGTPSQSLWIVEGEDGRNYIPLVFEELW